MDHLTVCSSQSLSPPSNSRRSLTTRRIPYFDLPGPSEASGEIIRAAVRQFVINLG